MVSISQGTTDWRQGGIRTDLHILFFDTGGCRRLNRTGRRPDHHCLSAGFSLFDIHSQLIFRTETEIKNNTTMMLSLIRGTTFRQRGLTNVFWSQQAIRPFSSSQEDALPSSTRLSKLISQRANLSRRKAERLIKDGEVTLAGQVVRSPQILVNWKDLYSNNTVVIKVQGKPLLLRSPANDGKQTRPEVPKVWAVHKLKGEIVSENDPHDRPSMIQRLVQGGVGRTKEGKKLHLKPIGRLDMPTEGLILVTNDGDYARKMELPSSLIHRVYRARVHGHLTSYKL